MSADNAVYIYGSEEWGWKVKDITSLDPENMSTSELDAEFADCAKYVELSDAIRRAERILITLDVCEYGIRLFRREPPLETWKHENWAAPTPTSVGWVCPKCGAVYAPATPECFRCNTGKNATGTAGNSSVSRPYYVDEATFR